MKYIVIKYQKSQQLIDADCVNEYMWYYRPIYHGDDNQTKHCSLGLDLQLSIKCIVGFESIVPLDVAQQVYDYCAEKFKKLMVDENVVFIEMQRFHDDITKKIKEIDGIKEKMPEKATVTNIFNKKEEEKND